MVYNKAIKCQQLVRTQELKQTSHSSCCCMVPWVMLESEWMECHCSVRAKGVTEGSEPCVEKLLGLRDKVICFSWPKSACDMLAGSSWTLSETQPLFSPPSFIGGSTAHKQSRQQRFVKQSRGCTPLAWNKPTKVADSKPQGAGVPFLE